MKELRGEGGGKTSRFHWNWCLGRWVHPITWWRGLKGKGFYAWWLLQRFFLLLRQKHLMKEGFVFTHSLRSRASWGWKAVVSGAGGSWSLWICIKEAVDTSALHLPLNSVQVASPCNAPLMFRVLLKHLQRFVSPLILLSWHFSLCVLLIW